MILALILGIAETIVDRFSIKVSDRVVDIYFNLLTIAALAIVVELMLLTAC